MDIAVALLLLSVICLASCNSGGEPKPEKVLANGPAKVTSPRDCDSQYHELIYGYSEKVMKYVSWYMQNYGYDPKTLPDAATTITAQDSNSVTWSGTFTTYNTHMYDHSKFDPAWKMGIDCSGDVLGVELIVNVPSIETRSRFELNIANSNHHGFIGFEAYDYSFHVNYSVSYSDMKVHDFSIFQENIRDFSTDTNYYDPVIDWTLNSIQDSMMTTFSELYSNEYEQIVTSALYSAFQTLKIFA